MKIMQRNKQTFSYCLFDSTETLTDEYGNETGELRVIYSAPVEMSASVSPATGQSQVEQFGNLENYDKVIVTDDMACPISESSVLFIDKEPEFDENDNPMYDYVVRRVAKSLNSISIAVRKVKVGSSAED